MNPFSFPPHAQIIVKVYLTLKSTRRGMDVKVMTLFPQNTKRITLVMKPGLWVKEPCGLMR